MTDQQAPGSAQDAKLAIANLDRETWGRILATLARRFGDLDLAEDVTQEAYAQALVTWPRTGVPDSPEAWLKTTAKRKALDIVRREANLAQKLAHLRIEADVAPVPTSLRDPAQSIRDPEIAQLPDDRLELFFACAHPALNLEDRVALTLRFVAGLSAAEVGNALLVSVPTMQQRIARAKKRIRTLGIPFETPKLAELPARLGGVLRVLYLLYAEGFARSAGDRHVRDDLTAEAVRLVRILHSLAPDAAEVTGLLALCLLTEARRPAREDASGQPVPLVEQDRGRWDRELITEGLRLAERAAGSPEASGFAIQAAIAAVHAEGQSFESTDWAQIAVLYRLLKEREPGPIVSLGRAVALGRYLGLEEGLRRLDALAGDPVLARLRAFHVARGITLDELGRREQAAEAYQFALECPGNEAEDALIASTLAGLDLGPVADPGVEETTC
ncbi:RNA polymerase sigma factor [Gulosibacter chungangensis]|uniref:Sigma-70 family RNA polymerase sigma factor n=1 Tax=Gulosibacter chungangensis TaxID=979746 RepID=A0A7J5BD07_9MICO|nr:sigma-70 family RNA polymerase sigma factor [Gulosibacter chungangensis]KAB1643932.1 sigma-70 family RNA polymerase sigma factor [Gulosibacter chungangensis]